LQGIVSTVNPRLCSEILLAVESERIVVAVKVPPQDEPVFYYEQRPYIRDGRHSRPATPEEVRQCVWAHHSSEYHREIERIKLQQMQGIVDQGRENRVLVTELRRQKFVR
jgi:predicted HTH transcriptional regulator